MKKKIAMFTTGWGSEILVQFLAGMLDEVKNENTDIFLFLCYAAFADSPEKKTGEMNIFNLPDLHDFDGAVIFGSGLDYQDRIDNIISRCNDAGIPVIIQGAKREGWLAKPLTLVLIHDLRPLPASVSLSHTHHHISPSPVLLL